MTRSRFVQPETRRLPLSDGDWIVVKTRLSIGELRALQLRKYAINPVTEKLQLRVEMMGIADVAAYLVDWSLPEMAIRGASPDVIEAAVRHLEGDDFYEIEAAIDAHVAAVEAERAALKKTTTGEPVSAPISASPVAVAGAMSG